MALGLALAACGGGDGSFSPRPSDAPSATATATPATGVVAWAAGARLLRSDDGGDTWRTVLGGVASALAFVERDVGWIVAGSTGAVLKTTDGGERWQDQTLNVTGAPPVLVDVAAIDAKRAAAVGAENPSLGPDPLASGPPAAIVTNDGGVVWERAALEGIDGAAFADVRLLSVCLTPSGIGLATGMDQRTFDKSLVLVSRDAGRRWEDVTTRLPIDLEARAACGVGDDVWFLGGNSTVFRSADGGMTWEDRGADLQPGLSVQDAAFLSTSIGWLVASGPDTPGPPPYRIVLLATEDGGRRWRQRTVAGGLGFSFLSLDFIDGRHGVVVGQDTRPLAIPRSSFGRSFVTRDGGESWAATEHPRPIDALWEVDLLR